MGVVILNSGRFSTGGGPGAGVNSVSGNIVDNTNPANPVVNQVQSDWNQTDASLPDFINNKPAVLSMPISLTYADAQALAVAGTVVDGQQYLITNKADTGILLVGQPDGVSFSLAGSGGFLNADFQKIGNYSGVAFADNQGIWDAGNEGSYTNGTVVTFNNGTNNQYYIVIDSTLFDGTDPSINTGAYSFDNQGVWDAFNESAFIDDMIVIWNCLHYIVSDATLFDGTNPSVNNTAYSLMSKATANVGYIEEWDAIEYDFNEDRLMYRADRRYNKIRISVAEPLFEFQWGNNHVFYNNAISGRINCLNNLGDVVGNNILDGLLSIENNIGSVISNFISSSGSLSAPRGGQLFGFNTINGTNITVNGELSTLSHCAFIECNAMALTDVGLYNCIFEYYQADVDSPPAAIINKALHNGYSDFEGIVDITGLTTLDITAIVPSNSICGIINLTSSNATETINLITNFPQNFPFTLRPESGLIVTFTGTAVGAAAAGKIILPTVNFIADGTKGDWLQLRGDSANNPSIYSVQIDAQNYI